MEVDLSQMIYKVDDSWGKFKAVQQVPEAEISRLFLAALAGDWGVATILLRNYPDLLTKRTRSGEIVLHIAVGGGEAKHERFVEKLVEKMDEDDIMITDNLGNTALHFAAASRNWKIAYHLVTRNRKLATMSNNQEARPLFLAAMSGCAAMVEFLLPLSDFEHWNDAEKSQLLCTCIRFKLYGIAREIVQQYPILAVAKDPNGEAPLDILAHCPSAFPSRSQLGWWRTVNSSQQDEAFQLLERIWEQVLVADRESSSVPGDIARPAFVAAEFGNYEFLVKLLREHPQLLYGVNESSQSIYHLAVKHRHESIFSLIYEIGGFKDLVTTYRDAEENTMLHLAARLAPLSQLNSLTGAAFKTHRELLWYKEVEKIVPPRYRNMKNKSGQTPYELFIKEHKTLMEDGERWTKDTAHSYMIIAAVIGAIIFATAVTLPENNNNDGDPVLLNERLLMIFSSAVTISMLSCCSSFMTFLIVYIKTFTRGDFLQSLPVHYLLGGFMTLIVSLAGILVASCAGFFLYCSQALARVVTPLIVAFCASMMFFQLNYSLLADVTGSLYDTRSLFRSRNRLLTR